MAKMDVRISDSLLDEIIEYYRKADPIEFPTVFGIYIALKELKQIRATGLTPEEISTLKARLDTAIKDIPHRCFTCVHSFSHTGEDCNLAHYNGTSSVCLSWQWRGLEDSHEQN